MSPHNTVPGKWFHLNVALWHHISTKYQLLIHLTLISNRASFSIRYLDHMNVYQYISCSVYGWVCFSFQFHVTNLPPSEQHSYKVTALLKLADFNRLYKYMTFFYMIGNFLFFYKHIILELAHLVELAVILRDDDDQRYPHEGNYCQLPWQLYHNNHKPNDFNSTSQEDINI